MVAAYRRMAPVYDLAFGWSLEPGRRAAVRSLDARPGDHALEIGVGTGLALPRWPRHVRLTGIDTSPAMLARARRRCARLGLTDVDLRIMDAQRMDFPADHFDRIAAMYVVSVVPEPAAMLREIVRVARPGARVAIVNHFAHPRPVMRRLETWFAGATRWAGWDSSLPADVVCTAPGLRILARRPANWLGYWTLVEAEVRKT